MNARASFHQHPPSPLIPWPAPPVRFSRRHHDVLMRPGCCLGSDSDPAAHLRSFLLPILKSRHIKPDWASKDVLPRNAEAEEVRSGRIRNVCDYVRPQLRSPCLHSWRSSEVRILHCNDTQSTHDLLTPPQARTTSRDNQIQRRLCRPEISKSSVCVALPRLSQMLTWNLICRPITTCRKQSTPASKRCPKQESSKGRGAAVLVNTAVPRLGSL